MRWLPTGLYALAGIDIHFTNSFIRSEGEEY